MTDEIKLYEYEVEMAYGVKTTLQLDPETAKRDYPDAKRVNRRIVPIVEPVDPDVILLVQDEPEANSDPAAEEATALPEQTATTTGAGARSRRRTAGPETR